MKEVKCPACRRRFSVDGDSTQCARCGADLSLLIKLSRQAERWVCAALSDPAIGDEESLQYLKKAQFIRASPEVQQLINSRILR